MGFHLVLSLVLGVFKLAEAVDTSDPPFPRT